MEKTAPLTHPNDRLRQERLRHHWRQRELAEQLGTTVVTVNRWERGIQQPSAYFRVRLCALYGKSEEELGIFPEEEPISITDVAKEAEASSSGEVSRDEISPFTISVPISEVVQMTAQQQQNRTRMLRRLGYSYRTLLAQSLQGAMWIELGLSEKPDAVHNMTTLLLRSTSEPERVLPVGISIVQVYEDAGQELLILGEPGTGKSLLLLTLAQELVRSAEGDESLPLPVILPLSSWAVKRATLEDWVMEQLTHLYDVPVHLARFWVKEGQVLPLLDGLDEMEVAARAVCIEAINTFHRTFLTPLVVCSRTKEYDVAAAQQRLTLHQAVVIQPLRVQQVKAYLEEAGKPFAALRQVLKENEALQELVTTPLMLNVVLLAYQGTAIRHLPVANDQLQRQVWTDFIERMVRRKGDEKRYPLGRIRRCLGWLADQMRVHNQTVFYVEHMQPDWLSDRFQCAYKWWGGRMPSMFIGGLICILLQLLFFHAADGRDVVLFGLVGGVLGGVLSMTLEGKDRCGGVDLKMQVVVSVCVGVMVVVDEGWGIDRTMIEWAIHSVLVGGVFMVSTLLLLQMLLVGYLPITFVLRSLVKRWPAIGALGGGGWVARVRMIQRWHPEQAVWIVVLFGLSYEVLSRVYSVQENDALSIGLSIGLTSILIAIVVERYATGVLLTERLTWTWKSVRGGLFSLRHLRVCLLLLVCIVVPIGLGFGLIDGISEGLGNGVSIGLSEALSDGLSVGLGYWLLIGLYQSITQEEMQNEDRRVANEGIRRSVRNSVVMGVLSGGIIGGVMILSYGLRSELYRELYGGAFYGLAIGLHAGLTLFPSLTVVSCILVWLLSGGLATWRHYLIRFLLTRVHVFPWHAPTFLDDATARILLRRVGGGYSFTHRLLLDHFADAERYSQASTLSI